MPQTPRANTGLAPLSNYITDVDHKLLVPLQPCAAGSVEYGQPQALVRLIGVVIGWRGRWW